MMKGKVWKYGDSVNTDVIFPGRYTYVLMNEEEMGKHALEDLDHDFCNDALVGDIIVAGKNWGCGSAREQAVKCLKARGVGAIIAESFSRIYYRNCLNEGLITIVCPAFVQDVKPGDTVEIDMERNVVRLGKKEYAFPGYPPYVRGLIESGGLIPYAIKMIAERGAKQS